MNRPLVPIALSLAGGMLLEEALPDSLVHLLSLCGVGLFLLLPLRPKLRLRALGIVLLSLTAGFALSAAVEKQPGPLWQRAVQGDFSCTLEGRIADAAPLLVGDDYMSYTLRVDTLVQEDFRLRIEDLCQVKWTQPSQPLYPGSRVRVSGSLSADLGPENPGTNSYASSQRRRGLHTQVKARGPEAITLLKPAPAVSLFAAAARLRQAEARILAKAVPPDARPIARALWLGDRTELTHDRYKAFVRTGTAHVLAISGLHTAVFFASISSLLPLLIKNRKTQALVLAGSLLLLLLTTGARASVARAVLMILAYLSADAVGRERDAPSALAASVILMLLVDPAIVHDAGFQLSVLSVASLILFQSPIAQTIPKRPTWFWSLLSSWCAVQILPFCVVAARFHTLSLVSPLANLIVIPLITAAVWLTMLTVICGFLLPPASALFGAAFGAVALLLEGAVATAADMPCAALTVTSPGLVAAAACFAGLLCLTAAIYTHGGPKWRAYAGVLLLALSCIVWGWRPLSSRAVFLDVGHGDATVLHTPEGATLLVDAGDQSDYRCAGERIVSPYLLAHGIKRLDAAFVTHMDRDHAGGMIHILKNHDVEALCLSSHPSGRALEDQILRVCHERNIPVVPLEAGDSLQIGGAKISVLHPPCGLPGSYSINDSSLVLRVEWTRAGTPFSILLPGDIEAEAERSLEAQIDPVTLLKAPHHGSATSSTLPFLQSLRPAAVVVSTGGMAGREPVDPGVLARYAALHLPTLRTDRSGGIAAYIEKGRLVLETTQPRKWLRLPLPAAPDEETTLNPARKPTTISR